MAPNPAARVTTDGAWTDRPATRRRIRQWGRTVRRGGEGWRAGRNLSRASDTDHGGVQPASQLVSTVTVCRSRSGR